MEALENVVAIGFGVLLLWSYYRTCYSRGYTVDFWHVTMLQIFFTIHVMLPFSRSDLNIFALGPVLLRGAQLHVTEAYAISAVGYAAMLGGGQLWRLRAGLGVRRNVTSWLEAPALLSLRLMNARRLLRLHAGLAALCMFGVILLYFRIMGFGFDARSILIANPSIRPVGQFSLFYGMLIASYCLIRAVRYREPDMIGVSILLSGELMFFGSRASVLTIFLTVLTVGMIRMRRRLRLWFLLSGIGAAAFLAVFLDAVRSPNFSLSRLFSGLALAIFYGNSFSDTRDFAVVLSVWHGDFFLGKTYLAGLMAFVPQIFSPFRARWSMGVVTATLAGFAPTEHGGLRVGNFGEAYLNFGWVGVLMVGLFAGAVLRLVDLEVKRALRVLPPQDLRVYSFFIVPIWVGVAQNSTGASTVYTTLLILWLSSLYLRVFGPDGSLRARQGPLAIDAESFRSH